MDLAAEDPILAAFFEAIAARSKGQAPPPRLFQVPMRGDRALACFASIDLVGMMTEYATGVDFIDQIKLTISVLGIADIYD